MPIPYRPALVIAALASIVPFGLLAMSSTSSPSLASVPPTSEPDLTVRAALAHVGLVAPALAVAGLSSVHATRVVQQAQASEVVQQDRLRPARQSVASARAEVAALERAIRQGARERVQDLEAARNALSSAETFLQTLLDEIFEQATAGLSAPGIQTLRQVHANKRFGALPLEFLVTGRSDAEWAALEEALTHERVCTRLGEPTNPEIMTRLAAFRAEEAVAAARTYLQANRASVEAAWNAAAVLQ